MTPTVGVQDSYLSPMTLAVLEDSGWYTPDYSKSVQAVKGRPFTAARDLALVVPAAAARAAPGAPILQRYQPGLLLLLMSRFHTVQ